MFNVQSFTDNHNIRLSNSVNVYMCAPMNRKGPVCRKDFLSRINVVAFLWYYSCIYLATTIAGLTKSWLLIIDHMHGTWEISNTNGTTACFAK